MIVRLAHVCRLCDRRPLGRVLGLVLPDKSGRPPRTSGEKLLSLGVAPILSRNGASGKPGAVQKERDRQPKSVGKTHPS
jgi:hypothetical protein